MALLNPNRPHDRPHPRAQPARLAAIAALALAGRLTGPAAEPDPPARHAYLELVVPKTVVYLGEAVAIETRFYTLVTATEIQPQPLAGNGFTFGKSAELPAAQAQVGDLTYQVRRLRTFVLANKTGTLTLGPAAWHAVLAVPVARRQPSRDPFEAFIDEGLKGHRTLRGPVDLTSDTVPFTVRPLPTHAVPGHFTGAVGLFALNWTVTPTNVAIGEPITLKIAVSGRGALDNLALPNVDHWTGFKVYPPTSAIELTDDIGLEGAKNFEQVIVPQNLEVNEVPKLEFSFFDPAAHTYRTLATSPIPLVVRPAGVAPPLGTTDPAPSGATGSAQGIVHLKPRLGSLAHAVPPLIHRPWFAWLQAVPVLGLFAAWAWRRRRDYLERHPHLVRRQAVARHVAAGLAELERLAAAGQAEEFFATAGRLLQEQLGERLALPANAITGAVIEEHLEPRQVEAPLLATLRELFQLCDQARYAPTPASGALQTLIPKFAAALEATRRLEL